MKFLHAGCLVVVIGSPFILLGCSYEDDWTKDLPETVEASGTVTLNGEPIEGAAIVAAPTEAGKYPANALSDADGYFELKAFPSKDGAVPGSYLIMVSRTEAIGGESEESEESEEPATDSRGDHVATGGGGWRNNLPQKYANPKKSGLTLEVPAGGKTDILFELKG